MNLLLKFLLQLPLLAFLYVGIHAVVGINFWISILVGIGVLILYTTGEYLGIEK
jgi:hypothetical protein